MVRRILFQLNLSSGYCSWRSCRKPLPAAFRAGPQNFERFGPGVKREQDPLLDLSCFSLPFAVDKRQLVPSATDVRHAGPRCGGITRPDCCATVNSKTQRHAIAPC
jgi:hypothetical protein